MRISFVTIFTFMHLADAFIQSDLQCNQAIHFFFVCLLYDIKRLERCVICYKNATMQLKQ